MESTKDTSSKPTEVEGAPGSPPAPPDAAMPWAGLLEDLSKALREERKVDVTRIASIIGEKFGEAMARPHDIARSARDKFTPKPFKRFSPPVKAERSETPPPDFSTLLSRKERG